jgi:8-oxo-dGTP pyrophosphatase MutT (NUDIX family)
VADGAGTVKLVAMLARHVAADAKERKDLAAMTAWAAELDAPFSRSQWPAHFTGSAVVVDGAGERVCMVLHGRLKRWLQPGGHCEKQDLGDLEATALREAREETGLDVALHEKAPHPLDVDAHVIPAKGEEPEHTHLDVRFLVVAKNPEALKHDPNESSGAQWLSWDDALARADDPALKRMLGKARAVAGR